MTVKRRFFISKKKEIAYLNIEKSGCSSIKTAIAHLRDNPLEDTFLKIHDPDYFELYFLDVVDETEPFLTQCFKFTFVRSPVHRVVSFYKNKLLMFDPNVTPFYEKLGIYQHISFQEFIDRLVETDPENLEGHLAEQHPKIIKDGQILVDFIGKLEHSEAHWRILNHLIGENLTLPRINQTSSETRIILTPEIYEKISAYYAEDMYLFGYSHTDYPGLSGERADMKHRISNIMAEVFVEKKLINTERSQTDEEGRKKYGKKLKDLSINQLNFKDIDFLRDIAISLEPISLENAFKLMTIANKLRPGGPFISKKLDEYRIALGRHS